MTDKRWLLGIFVIGIIVAGLYFHERPSENHSDVRLGVFLWENGKKEFIAGKNSPLADYLIKMTEKVNLQAKCAFFEDRINLLKQNGRVIEVIFDEPINVTISQWIRPEERYHIPTDENGYRVLVNVEKVVFVLRGDLEGHVLTKSAGRAAYSCWAISKDGEIDEAWIDEVEKALKLNYKVEECSVFEPEKAIEYDESAKTLTAYVRVNCCGVNVTVEEENGTFRIIEKQHGELCRCMCFRKVTIYNVPVGARVEFVDKDGIHRTLTPRVNVAGFCGWSTYGECSGDEDCVADGCSGQVCRSGFEEQIGTTCEWFDCYNASKYNVACRCVDGKCQWVRK